MYRLKPLRALRLSFEIGFCASGVYTRAFDTHSLSRPASRGWELRQYRSNHNNEVEILSNVSDNVTIRRQAEK